MSAIFVLILSVIFLVGCKTTSAKSSLSNSSDTVLWYGAPIKRNVDLSRYWNHQVESQAGAGNCHLHTAAMLAEAAFFRIRNEHINLSEAYLFYRHLRRRFETFSNYQTIPDEDDQKTKSITLGDAVSNIPNQREAPYRWIANGSLCLEAEFDTPEFYEFLKALVEHYRSEQAASTNQDFDESSGEPDWYRTKRVEQEIMQIRANFPKTFCRALDENIECMLSHRLQRSEDGGAVVFAIDKQIQQWLGLKPLADGSANQLKYSVARFHTAYRFRTVAYDLLNAGIPFECTYNPEEPEELPPPAEIKRLPANYQHPPLEEIPTPLGEPEPQKSPEPLHSVVIYGYSIEGDKVHQPTWFIRDSLSGLVKRPLEFCASGIILVNLPSEKIPDTFDFEARNTRSEDRRFH